MSPLHIRKGLCHFPVSHVAHIHATNMPVLTSSIAPVIHPAHDASIASGEQVLGLEIGVRGRIEKILPKSPDSFLTLKAVAIWRWIGVFKHRIIGHESHQRVNIAP